MKSSLAVAAILLFAATAHAQSPTTPRATSAGGSMGNNYGGGGGWGSGGAWSGLNSPSGRPVVFEPPREFLVLVGENDGPFVPSTYMNYEDALALGKQMIAEGEAKAKGEGPYSLGEAARAARAAKVPTFRLKSRVTQDNSGKLQVCNLNGNDCHRP